MGTLMLFSRVPVSERSCATHTWMLCPTYMCVTHVWKLCAVYVDMSGRDVPLMYLP